MEGERFDDAFVAGAPVRERELHGGAPLPPPSRESLREVKREAKERRRAARGKPPRQSRRPRGLALLTLAAVVVGAGVFAAGRDGAGPSDAGAVPVVVPSHTPPPAPPKDPFSGTAVAGWPVGAAGVRAPAAKPVGTFTAAQVKDAYARSVRHLKAAMLDRRVVWQGDLAPVHATLSPASVRSRAKDDATVFGNRFRPTLRPASANTRVNGFLKARAAKDGELHVDYSYVATYAVRAKGGAELVAVRRTGTLAYSAADARRVSAPWLYRSGAGTDHTRCGTTWRHRGYLEVYLTPADEPAPTGPAGATATFNFLDPRATPPDGCFTNTGEL